MLGLSYLFNLGLGWSYHGENGEAMEQQASTETFGNYWQAATAMVPETQVKETEKKDRIIYVEHWKRTLQPLQYDHWMDVSENPEVNFSKNHLNITTFTFLIEPGDEFTKKEYGNYFYF